MWLIKLRLIPFIHKQQRLIVRRGGLKRHYNLAKRFAEIDNDPYVKKSREKYNV